MTCELWKRAKQGASAPKSHGRERANEPRWGARKQATVASAPTSHGCERANEPRSRASQRATVERANEPRSRASKRAKSLASRAFALFSLRRSQTSKVALFSRLRSLLASSLSSRSVALFSRSLAHVAPLHLHAPSLARSFARTLIRPFAHCSLLRRPALRSRSVTPQHVQEGGELRVWDQRDGAPEPQPHEERLGVDRDDEGPEERPQNVAEPGLANGDQNLLEDDLEAEVKVPARKGWVSLHT